MTFDEPKHPETGDPVYLSTKTILPEDRLIFALDVPTVEEARRLVTTLQEAVQFYKVGLELFLAGGASFDLIDWLIGQDKKVFLDLKLYDIPETVARAVRRLRERPVTFLTVHGDGAILEAACREKGDLKILAVTVLTSLAADRLTAAFRRDLALPDLVAALADEARAAGADGLVCSGAEVAALRARLGDGPLLVVPGTRPPGADAQDQARVVTPRAALAAGASWLVVGRAVTAAADPRAAWTAFWDGARP